MKSCSIHIGEAVASDFLPEDLEYHTSRTMEDYTSSD